MRKLNLKAIKLEYIRKRILLALGMHQSDEAAVYPGSRKSEIEDGMASAVYSALVEIYENFYGAYNLEVPFIDEKCDDSFEVLLEPASLEALVCLGASKLCTEEEASLYTRLLYKYKDLCESAFEVNTDKKSRNSFFAMSEKRGMF